MSSDGLVGCWDLTDVGANRNASDDSVVVRGDVSFGQSTDHAQARRVAQFAGHGHLEIPNPRGIHGDAFTVEVSVNASARSMSTLGDILSMFDTSSRQGFSLGFQHGAVCGSHANDRNLLFGIDHGTSPTWIDHGSPSETVVMIYALAVHEDSLYAATWEEYPSELGHVYRLDGVDWVDCGAPGVANAVTRLAVFEGHLYAGTSRVRGGGSGRPDSSNQEPGGRIYRYEGGREWSDQGQLEGADSVGGLVPFDGSLYATPLYSQGVFRMRSPGTWVSCGTPGRRLLALGVHDGALYGAGNDHVDVDFAMRQTAAGIVIPAESLAGGGGVFRYEGGESWVSCGLQPDTTQIYSIHTHDARMHISTWPSGSVFRQSETGEWDNTGRLGTETEVMALCTYNGMLYGGTLPNAEVHRLDVGVGWTKLKALDTTRDVMYRRAHSMCVFRGALYCGTLPAGTVHSMAAGAAVSLDHALGPGWHHVAGTKARDGLALYVDGALMGHTALPPGTELGLPQGLPLRIGGGPQANLSGELADVRLYDRALSAPEILAHAQEAITAARPVPGS